MWRMASGAAKKKNVGAKTLCSHKNDVQSVANGGRQRIGIKLR